MTFAVDWALGIKKNQSVFFSLQFRVLKEEAEGSDFKNKPVDPSCVKVIGGAGIACW